MTRTPTTFDRTTSLEPTGEFQFRACFDESWRSLGGVLGGYIAAHAVRAVQTVDALRDVRTVAVTFLRPSRPGEAFLEVETVRDGRALAVHDVVVQQAAQPVALARVTSSTPQPTSLSWATDPFELPPAVGRCEPICPPEGALHFQHADAVLDPAWRPFSNRDRAHVAGWVRPREARRVDATWLTMILDWFPPAAFARAHPPTGAVSVNFTVHIHRTATNLGDSWLAGVFRTDTAAGGLALEHGTIATADGTLLAESFHTRVA